MSRYITMGRTEGAFRIMRDDAALDSQPVLNLLYDGQAGWRLWSDVRQITIAGLRCRFLRYEKGRDTAFM